MRKIKFRAWDKENKKWIIGNDEIFIKIGHCYSSNINQNVDLSGLVIMQYTGLKDKNGLADIYEGDIIDKEGNIIGNQYENSNLLKRKTNLLIQGFGTKTWCSTYKKAVGRGCKDAE